MTSEKSLNYTDRLILGLVLETAIDQLAIVKGTLPSENPEYPSQKHPNVSELPLDYLIQRENKILRKNHDAKMLSKKRVAAEAGFLQGVFEDILDDLLDTGEAKVLCEAQDKNRSRAEERVQIGQMEKSIRQEIAELRSLIETAKERSSEQILAESMSLAHLKDTLLEARRMTKGEEDFIQELEKVREQERIKTLENEEKNLALRRDHLKRDIELEQRVTLDIESWLSERRSHLKAQHRIWSEKLKGDLAKRDAELQELNHARENDLRRKEAAEKELADAHEYVAKETKRREEEAAARERFQLETRKAIQIQSWWRMIMVQRNLGPYRKKKQKKGDKKQKKRKF